MEHKGQAITAPATTLLENKHPSFASYCSHLRRRSVRPRTLESYIGSLSVFAGWLDQEALSPLAVSMVDLERFRGWLAVDRLDRRGRGVSLGRQAYYVAVLRDFYRYCTKHGLTLVNPAAGMAYPKQSKRLHRDILTRGELQRLLDQPGDDARGLRDRVALRLLALSGLRASDAVGLTIGDVNVASRELVIRNGKGGKDRLAFIDGDTQRLIARYLVALGARLNSAATNDMPLLIDLCHIKQRDRVRSIKGVTRHRLNLIVKAHAKAAHITKPVTCHSLRRSFCTLMLQAHVPGVNLKSIAEMVGHSSLKTTARYTHVDITSLSAIYHDAHPAANGEFRGEFRGLP